MKPTRTTIHIAAAAVTSLVLSVAVWAGEISGTQTIIATNITQVGSQQNVEIGNVSGAGRISGNQTIIVNGIYQGGGGNGGGGIVGNESGGQNIRIGNVQ